MFPRTIEGVLFGTTGMKGVLFMPIPFNPRVKSLISIDDCNTEYWVHQQPSQSWSKDLELNHKPIQINTRNTNILYTVYFADQTGNFPKNKTIEAMALKSLYTSWLGVLLVIKSDKEKHPITCDGNDTFYIPEATEQLVFYL